jgi:hypothetical protein
LRWLVGPVPGFRMEKWKEKFEQAGFHNAERPFEVHSNTQKRWVWPNIRDVERVQNKFR